MCVFWQVFLGNLSGFLFCKDHISRDSDWVAFVISCRTWFFYYNFNTHGDDWSETKENEYTVHIRGCDKRFTSMGNKTWFKLEWPLHSIRVQTSGRDSGHPAAATPPSTHSPTTPTPPSLSFHPVVAELNMTLLKWHHERHFKKALMQGTAHTFSGNPSPNTRPAITKQGDSLYHHFKHFWVN